MDCLLTATTNILSELENLFQKSTSLRIKTELAIQDGLSSIESSSERLNKTARIVGQNTLDQYKI